MDSLGVRQDEAAAFAATVCFLLGVFSGRYIAGIWLRKVKIPSTMSIFLLAFTIIIFVAWIFFHADFPLGNRTGINLMLFWIPFMIVSITVGALLKTLHGVNQRQLLEAQQEAAHSKSELQLLQTQLSPHFLFNTLNNLYGLSITDHEKMPPLLLKLSELLRYSVYNGNEMYVPIQDEVAYIKNYIAFERLRIEDRLQLNIDVEEVAHADIKIAPMLLIVFIENAFKHSKNTAAEKIFIDIKLKLWGNSVLFSVKNSYDNQEKEQHLNKNSGVGLPNVTKRLQLLYPGMHDLNVRRDDNYYTVELQLKAKTDEQS